MQTWNLFNSLPVVPAPACRQVDMQTFGLDQLFNLPTLQPSNKNPIFAHARKNPDS